MTTDWVDGEWYQEPSDDGSWRMMSDPNCEPSLWWHLARAKPIEAMLSPLFDLFTLEHPDGWRRLQDSFVRTWIQDGFSGLDQREKHAFIAEISAEAISLFERIYPGHRKGRAILRSFYSKLRLYVEGESTWEEYNAAVEAEASAPMSTSLRGEWKELARLLRRVRLHSDYEQRSYTIVVLREVMSLYVEEGHGKINTDDMMFAQWTKLGEQADDHLWERLRPRLLRQRRLAIDNTAAGDLASKT